MGKVTIPGVVTLSKLFASSIKGCWNPILQVLW